MITSSRLGTPLATGGSSDIFAWGEGQVVKRFRRGTPVTAAAREAACTRAARAAGAPAPETFGVIELDGDNGVVFERIEGPSMLEPLLAGRHDPVFVGRALAGLHAQLHHLSSQQLPNQRTQLLDTLRRTSIDERERDTIIDRLARLSDGDRICHGDFHPGNVLLASTGSIVIDWYDAVCGSTVADVAQTCLLLQHAEAPGMSAAGMQAHIRQMRGVLHDAYLTHYRELNSVDEHDLADWRLVMAAARLGRTPSPTERSALMAVIRNRLQSLNARPS